MITRRFGYYLGGWLIVLTLMVVNQYHRATSGQLPHLHTQLVSVAVFALLVVLAVWGGLMLNRHFERGQRREGDVL